MSVSDLTGRTLTRTVSINDYPKDYFIGIESTDYYFGVNENLTLNLIAISSEDQIIQNFKAKAQLVRYEWQTMLKRVYSGNYYYVYEQKEFKESKRI